MRYFKQDVPISYELTGYSTPKTKTEVCAYLPDNFEEIDLQRSRPLVVICPGGGYEMTSDREAEAVALQFLAADMAVIVLRYAVAPDRYPLALLELAATLRWARQNAQDFHIDPTKIVVAGFSAGGHLSANLATSWNQPFVAQALQCAPEDLRPNASLLCYPVITADEHGHAGSMKNLYGSTEKAAEFTLHTKVGAHTPPTFLWHTFEDSVVPLESTLLYANALRAHGIPFELHVYPSGGHGLSLATKALCREWDEKTAPVQNWMKQAIDWITLQV